MSVKKYLNQKDGSDHDHHLMRGMFLFTVRSSYVMFVGYSGLLLIFYDAGELYAE